MAAVRPYSNGGELRTDFGSLDHPTMKAMLDRGDPRTIAAMAATWEAAGSTISEQAAGFEDGLAALRERWRGPAADAYVAKMGALAATLRGTAEACFRTRCALIAAAEALTAAKQQMPAPSAGNDGHSRAVAVMKQLSDRYLTAQAAIPAPPEYPGPQGHPADGGGSQPTAAHASGPAGGPGTVAPGVPPDGRVMLTSAVVPGHSGAAPVAPASPAGGSPPGAMLRGALNGGQAGVAGAADGGVTGAAAGPAGGPADAGAPIPPGIPLFPATGAAAAAVTGPPGQGRSGAGGLFADVRRNRAPGLPPGGVIDAHPAGPAEAQPADDVARPPVPRRYPVTAPDGAAVTPLPSAEAGAQPTGTRRTTWLIESADGWGTGPAAPPVLGDQHHGRDR